MTLDGGWFSERLLHLPGARRPLAEALGLFASGTRRYLVVSTVFGLIVAVFDTLALVWIGVPGAALWGLLAFVTNYVPNIGFVIGIVPPTVLALLEGGPAMALTTVIAYVVISMVIQSMIQPKIVGSVVGLSGTVTMLSLVFWAFTLGHRRADGGAADPAREGAHRRRRPAPGLAGPPADRARARLPGPGLPRPARGIHQAGSAPARPAVTFVRGPTPGSGVRRRRTTGGRPRRPWAASGKVLADPLEQAARLELVAEVLLEPGQREHDALVGELAAQRLQGVEGGDVDLDDRLGVEHEPRHRGG